VVGGFAAGGVVLHPVRIKPAMAAVSWICLFTLAFLSIIDRGTYQKMGSAYRSRFCVVVQL
jgi:hypothetical protein